ncbi:putative Clp protease, ATP-binding subunit ClpX [Helianthus annuus]|uniref:Clp protease, ATP-binding subunit ClpX n=1 Tax=Helianthus annuus TaxID=4232 RepID=A0A9K3NA79_HELAN|nr:putative Clp protease, ATP-binding subunit ClpX [Helianthus annuus]KAJ0527172.1 hypothetical protein HanHA300_Chr09g0331191 [Helianthus annuus]KAJ0543573.1 hypothetical protein HanHA89_Chr09g0352161 [Helianthus annuus]KAJ0708627.1 hypothetical protein HanLR1_Chr09g0331471 [Helianthus annuus]KAJ0889661.1 putative Clp protease, ATP-binding subunit ClpX [Helianthus annuus]
MSGLRRWRKIQDIVAAATARARIHVPYTSKHGFVNCPLHAGSPYMRPRSLTAAQARYNWDHAGGRVAEGTFRAEVNCPRCSKLMSLVFSNNHRLIPPSSLARDEHEPEPLRSPVSDVDRENTYQAVNLCCNCKTAFYFRSYRLNPLLGRFVEIGRPNEDDINGNKLKASFWEKLKAFGGEPPQNGIRH